MRVETFQANSLSEALRMIKTSFGDQAIILSSRTLEDAAVEITAGLEETEPHSGAVQALTDQVRSELRAMRAELRPLSNTLRADIRKDLHLIRQMLVDRPVDRELKIPERTLLCELAAQYQLAKPPEASVIAAVGPTGAGKTTTVAKMASWAALVEQRRVGLLSLDNYRVGGVEQLRMFADLIGIPMTVARNYDEFDSALKLLEECDRIYIDTAGRSPRDRRAIDELVAILVERDEIEIHLTIPAYGAPRDIDRWVTRVGPSAVDRLILTKLDEAESLHELVEAPARLQKPVSYVTIGQRIPEDLEMASNEILLSYALERLPEVENEQVSA